MSTFSRVRYVIAANVNSLLEKAEDPEKLLRALIREMEEAGEDARMAAAELLAEQQHLERRCLGLEQEIGEWENRAEQAVEADREDLARAALKARAELSSRHQAAVEERDALANRIAQLERDMTTLKSKLAEARARLRDLRPRPGKAAAEARHEPAPSRHERRLREAMGRFDRLQRQVERLEARVRSYEVGGEAPSPWVPDDAADDPAVEAELEALKARVHGKSSPAPLAAQSVEDAGSADPESS